MASVDRVRVEVLGPLRALDAEGRDLTPPGRLQRRLLSLLVLRRGRVVSAETAIDALWPVEPPQDPVAALQNHLFRLRRGFPDGLIDSVGAGYRLDGGRIDLDLDRLVALLAEGVDPVLELVELDALLDRWQGPAFPELDDLDEGRLEAARLAELRIRAREARAAARLAAGAADGLAPELVALVDEEPLRERPRALLMSVLASTGRTAEALRVYDDFRRLLGDELGAEPSPTLVAQHAELLAGAEPAPAGVVAGRIPVPPTPLVGRDALLAELAVVVRASRAVTLVGPGGVGKTRLLVELAHRLQAARPDRPVALCELAQSDQATAVDAVASALGIDARPGVPPIGRIVHVLGEIEAVLLLDNCEHVLDAAAEVVEQVVRACPRVTVVATSRERLRVPGEHVLAVPTLLSGDGEAAALELFSQRAAAVRPGFAPTDEERTSIVEIVHRLDGLPLAIELAAARLHTHEVAEVAVGLDRRFSLLSTGSRTSARHASLAAAISWSYGLLDEERQHDFAALSVFCGPFTAPDAAAVFGVGEAEAGEALALLVERSLVMRAPGRRYVLLETLRAFGAEQLEPSGRAEVVRERHARRFLDWIEDLDRRMLEPRRGRLADVDGAIPELRAALGWLLDRGLVVHAGRLVIALLDYGILRLRPDVLAWAEAVAAADPDDRSPSAARVWVAAAYAAWMAGDVPGAGVRTVRALQAAERSGGAVPPEVLTIRGSYALFEGRLQEAADSYRQAVEASADDPTQRRFAAASELLALGYAREPRAVEQSASLLAGLGEEETASAAYVWYCAGEADLSFDVERARSRLARAIEMAEATTSSFVLGIAGASKASIDARIGDPLSAAAEYRWLIGHWRRAGMWSTQWTMLRSIAGLLERLGLHRDAAVIVGAVRATDAGHRIFGADEVALDELDSRLRVALGDLAYEAALADGAALDGEAAVEHALRSL